MKFQKIIRVPGIVIAVGAALLLGSSARAQQEVEPTTFEIVPGEQASGQVPGRAARSFEAAKEMAAKVAEQEATQNGATTESRITQLTASDVAGMLMLMSGMGVIVLCAIAGRWPKRYRSRFTQRRAVGNGEHGVEFESLDSVVKQWCERVGPPA
jgi:hypothetical protein